MNNARLVLIVLVVAAASAGLRAQGLQALAGTWIVDPATKGSSGRGGGVPGFPLASQLTIRTSPAEVVVESDTGSAGAIQTFVYKLDGTVTNVPGPLGWETTARATAANGGLVVTVTRTIAGPNGPVSVDVTDTYSVDGAVLTIDRRQGRTTQKLVYNRR